LFIGELSESGAENQRMNGSFSASSGSSSCLSDTDSDDALMVSQELRPGFCDQVRHDVRDRRSRADSGGDMPLELFDDKDRGSLSPPSEVRGTSRRSLALDASCTAEVDR
jgi:hypothetical protein